MVNISELLTTWNPDRVCFHPHIDGGVFVVCGLPLFAGDFCAEHGEVGAVQELFRAVMYAPPLEGDFNGDTLRIIAVRLSLYLRQYFDLAVPAALLYGMLAGLGLTPTVKDGL